MTGMVRVATGVIFVRPIIAAIQAADIPILPQIAVSTTVSHP
jgi:hypothetical protein